MEKDLPVILVSKGNGRRYLLLNSEKLHNRKHAFKLQYLKQTNKQKKL